jgi:hypothetical protein
MDEFYPITERGRMMKASISAIPAIIIIIAAMLFLSGCARNNDSTKGITNDGKVIEDDGVSAADNTQDDTLQENIINDTDNSTSLNLTVKSSKYDSYSDTGGLDQALKYLDMLG